jgi:hypothetical protein
VTILPRVDKFEKWTNLRVVGSIPVKVILYNQTQNSPMGMYIPFNVKNELKITLYDMFASAPPILSSVK